MFRYFNNISCIAGKGQKKWKIFKINFFENIPKTRGIQWNCKRKRNKLRKNVEREKTKVNIERRKARKEDKIETERSEQIFISRLKLSQRNTSDWHLLVELWIVSCIGIATLYSSLCFFLDNLLLSTLSFRARAYTSPHSTMGTREQGNGLGPSEAWIIIL